MKQNWMYADTRKPSGCILRRFCRGGRGIVAVALLAGSVMVRLAGAAGPAASGLHWKFDFGAGPVAKGWIPVSADTRRTEACPWGFLPGAAITDGTRAGAADACTADFCACDQPFFFTLDVPRQGNYRVTVTIGADTPTCTVVKAESRRLMLEKVQADPGSTVTQTFIVNVRNARLPEGRSVRLKSREIGVFHWDDQLTLEFNGRRPSVCALEVQLAEPMPTLFLAGDSTVTDQTKEPWTSWGQMLTRFFQPSVAVANYAESGETLSAFIGERRLEKILTQIRPGDYLFIQFGHNDMKRGTPAQVGYVGSLRRFIDAARSRGARPVLVTPMHRRRFDAKGRVVDTMGGFPEAMKALARAESVALIDLHAMSRTLYQALGPEGSAAAFVDGTHHSAYGAYELARCVVEGIRAQLPRLAARLAPDVAPFDPACPDPVRSVIIPASPMRTDEKPQGS